MADKCVCHINGYEVKDATARAEIEALKSAGGSSSSGGSSKTLTTISAGEDTTLFQTSTQGWYRLRVTCPSDMTINGSTPEGERYEIVISTKYAEFYVARYPDGYRVYGVVMTNGGYDMVDGHFADYLSLSDLFVTAGGELVLLETEYLGGTGNEMLY